MAALETDWDTETPSQEADVTRAMFPVDQRHSSQSPLRPGSTLIAYQPNGNTSPRTPARMGKSQHLAQIRSLGLLHDLQEYISSVETLAAEQKRELEKVREEKRDMEKFLARAEVVNQERQGGILDFSVSEVADLPPRMRAIVEDNRGLRELARRYKLRTASLEHQVAQQQSQMLALAEANERLKQSLAECSRTPAEVDREEQLRRQLDLKNRQVENLEHGLGVMRAKVETDNKLYRQNLASAAREKDALKRQLVAANKALEERDKELRALNVELRKVRRGAPPTRGGGPYHPPGTAPGADDDGASGAAAAAAAAATALAAAAAPPPREEPEERIRIMLIIVRDEIKVPVEVPVPVPVPMMVETPGTPLEGGPGTDPGQLLVEDGGCDPEELTKRLQLHAEQEQDPQQTEADLDVEPAEAASNPDATDADVEAAEPPEAAPIEELASEPPNPETETVAPEPSLAMETTSTEEDPAAELLLLEAATDDPSADPAALVAELEALLGPAVASEPALEEVLANAAPEPSAEAALEPLAEPSASGLLLEELVKDGLEVGGQGEERGGGAGELGTEEGGVLQAAAAATEEGPAPSGDAEPPTAALHSHVSQPQPVPYARTTARALAAKVGGPSVKHPHPPPHGPGALQSMPSSHRKNSGGGASLGGAGSVGGKSDSGHRASGGVSRKH